jgi:dTDP-4-amino-4,6-dideoxygalactose transaminase
MQFIDLKAQQARIKDKIDARFQTVLSHGQYIMGPEVKELEQGLSEFCGVNHTVSCANGTDALSLALMALDVGKSDAVFVPSFTFAATAEVIPQLQATPVFVDVDEQTFNMDPHSLKQSIFWAKQQGLNPAVVIPVDLFGLPADYDKIQEIASENNMKVIGDSAQGFGGTYKGRTTGTLADITTTSFFPAKPLGCYGDGGALFTNDPEIADLLESFRVHGKGREKYDNVRLGMNSRLDTLQAAFMLEKLAIYADELEARQRVASTYMSALGDVIKTPTVPDSYTSVWAQFTLTAKTTEDRNTLMDSLKQADIPSMVYYPKPLHKQQAFAGYISSDLDIQMSDQLSKRVFSIPMHPYLSQEDQSHVIKTLRTACAAL